MANLDKLNKIVSEKSNWIEEAKQRQKNKSWLKHSQKIAIKVLKTIKEKGIKQKQLAEMMNVSPQHINKIVKGRENLTLETISKLESVLNLKLIFENETIIKEVVRKKYIMQKETIYLHAYSNTSKVIYASKKINGDDNLFVLSQVNESEVKYG